MSESGSASRSKPSEPAKDRCDAKALLASREPTSYHELRTLHETQGSLVATMKLGASPIRVGRTFRRMAGRLASLVVLSLLPACGGSTSSVDSSMSDAGHDAALADGSGDAAIDLASPEHESSGDVDAVQRPDSAGSSDAMDASAADHTPIANDASDAPDGSTCGSLANTSPGIAATEVNAVPRTYQGGSLADGTYVLFAVEETISSAPAKFKRTLRISSVGKAFEWVINDPMLPPDHHFMGSIAVSGTNLVLMDQCTGAMLTYPFDASGTTLTMYFLVGTAGGRIFQYHTM
jgi:hypothetical protein